MRFTVAHPGTLRFPAALELVLALPTDLLHVRGHAQERRRLRDATESERLDYLFAPPWALGGGERVAPGAQRGA